MSGLTKDEIRVLVNEIYVGLTQQGHVWAERKVNTSRELLSLLQHAKDSISENRYNWIVKYINLKEPDLIRSQDVQPTQADEQFVQTFFDNLTVGQKKAMIKLCYGTDYNTLKKKKLSQRRLRVNRSTYKLRR